MQQSIKTRETQHKQNVCYTVTSPITKKHFNTLSIAAKMHMPLPASRPSVFSSVLVYCILGALGNGSLHQNLSKITMAWWLASTRRRKCSCRRPQHRIIPFYRNWNVWIDSLSGFSSVVPRKTHGRGRYAACSSQKLKIREDITAMTLVASASQDKICRPIICIFIRLQATAKLSVDLR